MLSPLLFVLVVLASYRLTRFLVADTLIDNQRIWVINKLMTSNSIGWRKTTKTKVAYLITCPFCSSAYISAVVMGAVWLWDGMPLPLLVWPAAWGGVALVWNAVED